MTRYGSSLEAAKTVEAWALEQLKDAVSRVEVPASDADLSVIASRTTAWHNAVARTREEFLASLPVPVAV